MAIGALTTFRRWITGGGAPVASTTSATTSATTPTTAPTPAAEPARARRAIGADAPSMSARPPASTAAASHPLYDGKLPVLQTERGTFHLVRGRDGPRWVHTPWDGGPLRPQSDAHGIQARHGALVVDGRPIVVPAAVGAIRRVVAMPMPRDPRDAPYGREAFLFTDDNGVFHFFEHTGGARDPLFHPIGKKLPLWNPLTGIDEKNLMRDGVGIQQIEPTGGGFYDVLLTSGALYSLAIFNVSGTDADGKPKVRYQPAALEQGIAAILRVGDDVYSLKKEGTVGKSGPFRTYHLDGAPIEGTVAFATPPPRVRADEAFAGDVAELSSSDFVVRFSPGRILELSPDLRGSDEVAAARAAQTFIGALGRELDTLLATSPGSDALGALLRSFASFPPSALDNPAAKAAYRRLLDYGLGVDPMLVAFRPLGDADLGPLAAEHKDFLTKNLDRLLDKPLSATSVQLMSWRPQILPTSYSLLCKYAERVADSFRTVEPRRAVAVLCELLLAPHDPETRTGACVLLSRYLDAGVRPEVTPADAARLRELGIAVP